MEICLLKWSIENFSLCPWNDRFAFRSQEFAINTTPPTQWKLKLYTKYDKDLGTIVLLDLVRCGIRATPKIVEAKCILMAFTRSMNNLFCKEIRTHSFKINSRLTFPYISTAKNMFRICRTGGLDALVISCEIITQNREKLAIRSLQGEPEFEKLSEDLNRLYESKKFCDMSLQVEGRAIPVHKAILHTRSREFSRLIRDMDPKENILSLNDMNYEILDRVIHFIYTGKISDVLSMPSAELYWYAKQFCVRELEEIFTLHEIASNCIIEMKHCSFGWLAADIHLCRRVSDHIRSPWIKSKDLDIPAWRLMLFPLGEEGSSEHIAIYIQLADWPECVPLAFKISLADNFGSLCYSRAAVGVTSDRGICGFRYFVERKSIPSDLFDPFRINCQITFPTRNLHNSTTNHKVEFVSDLACNHRQYNVLFKHMRDLYTSPKYSDIFLEMDGIQYPAHKSILSTRSRVLGRMISNLSHDGNEKPVLRLRMSRHVGQQIVQYIYFGKINVFEPNIRSEIFDAADRYGLDDLKHSCIQFIKEFSRGTLSGSSSSS